MAEVSLLRKQTVVSTRPVEPGKLHHLSVLDRAMEASHLCMVYYYQSPVGRPTGELSRKLRLSLCSLLSSFPMVTGRLVKGDGGNWVIKCNDAGVRMVEARARGSVEAWLQCVDREKELKLVHWEDMFHKPYFWATVYVQLTEFEEGGLAIGLSFTHLLLDPICATMFVKAWADSTSLCGKMPTPPLVHPLPPRRPANRNINHQPYTSLINHYKSSFQQRALAPKERQQTTVMLAFTDQMVQSCMAMARASSPFEALAALFWVCVSKVKGIKGDQLTDMSICLDTRKVLGLNQGFFGNCMVYNRVQVECLGENKLSEAAGAIRGVERKMDTEGIMDLIEWLESNNHQSPSSMNGHDFICANLEGTVESYSSIFEDGFSPIHVSYYIEPVFGGGQVLILPSPPAEGPHSRVVMVTIAEDEAVRLCEDALVLHLAPTISMGVKKSSA